MDGIAKPTCGAVIYAGNDSLIKVGCHRDGEDGTVLGYEKLRQKSDGTWATCEVPIANTSMSKYTMVSVNNRTEYVLYAATHMNFKSVKVYDDVTKLKPHKGVIRMEGKPLGNGKFLCKGDSHG